MARAKLVVLVVATVATGCTSPSEKARLEKRVAELERQLAVQSPAPEGQATPIPLPPTPFAFPEGAQFTLVLESSVSSASSHVGDKLTARLERARGREGMIPFATGTSVEGRVTEARPSGKVKGRARLSLAFDQIVLRGQAYPCRRQA